MHCFTDTAGRTWEMSIHVGSIRRVKALTGIDMPSLYGDELRPLQEIANDPVKFAEVLWALVKFQGEKSGINQEAFLEALAGDSLDHALRAFLEELADFFPAAKAMTLRNMVGKIFRIQELLKMRADKELENQDLETWAEKLTSSSGAAPASSASTPDPSP